MSRRRATRPVGQMVSISDRKVHVLLRGPVEATCTVILLHGASGNVRDFLFGLIERLEPTLRVIAFDRPGLGHTKGLPGDGDAPVAQARLLDEAAAALGVRRAVIVGHSYGAAVAMAWALDLPERVAAVVSLAGATMPWEGALWPWYRIASSDLGGRFVVPLVSALTPRAVVHSAIDKIFAPQQAPKDYAEALGVDLLLNPDQLRINARQIQGLKPHLQAMSARYPDLDVPIEIVHGDLDTIVPLTTHSARLVRLVPAARLTVLPGVGHMPHHADPEAAAGAILRAAGRAGLR